MSKSKGGYKKYKYVFTDPVLDEKDAIIRQKLKAQRRRFSKLQARRKT